MVTNDILPAAIPSDGRRAFKPCSINYRRAIGITRRVDRASDHDHLPDGETRGGCIGRGQVL